ncbi:hypothetical protein B0H17DRAFT_489947 [Mycena rosella]|uniref:Uncharacterized protein n=1 Tax=Mycena rosella TaxID=1033263 RepID=A0AAD7DKU5_MYCRO|nr:hypothetical protein B0H17DRAFT_489947 [Mycena rosella]
MFYLDARRVDGTWSAATYNSGLSSMTISMDFTGTVVFERVHPIRLISSLGIAIYVYFILANNEGVGIKTTTSVNLTLDGAKAGTFMHTPTSSVALQYNNLVFTQSGLSINTHSLIILTEGPDDIYVNFDYAIYTHEEPDPATTTATTAVAATTASPTATTAATASTTKSASVSSQSITSSTATSGAASSKPAAPAGAASAATSSASSSTTFSSTPKGAIAGGVIGRSILLAAIAGLLFWSPPPPSSAPRGPCTANHQYIKTNHQYMSFQPTTALALLPLPVFLTISSSRIFGGVKWGHGPEPDQNDVLRTEWIPHAAHGRGADQVRAAPCAADAA